MKTKIALGLVGAVLMSLSAAQAEDFWVKKDPRDWSEKECRKLLSDSPWAKKRTLSQVIIEDLGAIPNQGGSNADIGGGPAAPSPLKGARAREMNPRMTYEARFVSAQPIRQATVCSRRYAADYDKMSPEAKEEFDASAANYLAKEFPDTVVVQVFFGSNVHHDARELTQHWRSQTTDTLKNFSFLIGAKGMKAPLLNFAVAESGQMFQMVFPRQIDGQPLVSPNDKSLQLEFPHPQIRSQRNERILLNFKLKKMRLNDSVAF